MFLEENGFVDKHIQKGFWPTIDGVAEHTQVLSHVIRDAKRHQRSIVITLLDLRNAFGEVNHGLISASLKYHHVPDEIISIIRDIYTGSMISVAVNKLNTHFIPVDRGVLQGDPSSPLLFNLCFNPLMRTLSQPKFKHLGYMWGPNVDPYSSSWLQFADDTAIIANDVKSAQTLINLNVAWCKWSGMHLRIDKCVSFGMRKQEGVYSQYLPNLTINDSKIPALELGSSFKYLGKLFNFEMNNDEAKSNLINRLSGYLEIIKNLKVKVTMKLKILRVFIPSQFNFDLRIYDFAYTWIEQNLDQLSVNAVNEWLELPNGTCTAEFLQLPMKQGGYGIPSMKTTAQRLRLSLRFRLKHNIDDDLRDIWHATSNNNNIPLDALIIKHQTKSSAMEALEFDRQNAATQHVTSLKVQGRVFATIKEAFEESIIYAWSTMSCSLPDVLFSFVRKAFQQQLPTASNLCRWRKTESDKCKLCGSVQTNKHTLNNCSSPSALQRYKSRHDHVLEILVQWILATAKENLEVFIDLDDPSYKPLSTLFVSLRPDIAIKHSNTISTLELTICHESNAVTSKQFKKSKYNSLNKNLLPQFSRFKLSNNTIEVTTLGFISDTSEFSKLNLNEKMPDHVKRSIFNSVISDSYSIYCLRNAK